MLPLMKLIFVGFLTTAINGQKGSIDFSTIQKSSDTLQFVPASQQPVVTNRFGLKSLVPNRLSKKVSGLKLFGAPSNNYPTSIQHKIPHLAKALGNTRYVTIAQDPTLVQTWKTSPEHWASLEDNAIVHDPQEGSGRFTSATYKPDRSKNHVSAAVQRNQEYQIQQQQQQQQHRDAFPQQMNHRTYFPSLPLDARKVPESPQNAQASPPHDKGRNKQASNQSNEYRSLQASGQLKSLIPSDKQVNHVHHYSRHSRRLSTREPASSEEPATSSRNPKDWSLDLRYGHKRPREGCSNSIQEKPLPPLLSGYAPLHKQARQERLRHNPQEQRKSGHRQTGNEQSLIRREERPGSSQEERPGSSQEGRSRTSQEERSGSSQEEGPRSSLEEQPRSSLEEQPRSSLEEQPRSSLEEQPRSSLEEQARSSQEEQPISGQKDQFKSRQREEFTSTQGEQPVIRRESQTPFSSLDRRPNSSSWRNSPGPYDQQRTRYNDLPIVRARWSNQPYRSQETRTVPTVQMIHDQPEWETVEQNFRDYYTSPHGRKLVRNNQTKIFEEEFDEAPHTMSFAQPVHHNDYRYAGFPSHEHGEGQQRSHKAHPRPLNRFPDYGTQRENSHDLDIEEILSEDEEADVGIVAISNQTPNRTDNNRGNSSQDFLMNGELRFPEQNVAGLKQLTQLLKTVPEKQKTSYPYDRNATRGKVVRTTKNIAITRETFVDGSYDDRALTPRPDEIIKNSWTPLSHGRANLLQPTVPPSMSHVQKDSVLSKSGGRSNSPRKAIPPVEAPGEKENDNKNDSSRPRRRIPELHKGFKPRIVSRMPAANAEPTSPHGLGHPGQGILRKRIQKIQTHSTIEVLPMNPINHTELPVYDDTDESSEEADYTSSREQDTPYNLDYYQQKNPKSRQNRTTEVFPATRNPPITQLISTLTTTTAPEKNMDVVPVIKVPTLVTKVPRGFAQPMPLTKGWQRTTVLKQPKGSEEFHTGISSIPARPTRKPTRSQEFLWQNQPKACNKKNCQLGSKLLASKELIGGTPAANPILTATTPVPFEASYDFTQRPSYAATTTKKLTFRKRRRKVTASPSKETASIAAAASNAEQLTFKGLVQQPANRRFLKRKGTGEELQEPQLAEASEEDRRMRVQFHMQGFSGPESYRYGFHTADPYNPLERFEEKDREGRVRGHYSYIDPTGKKIVVNYTADQNGFQIVKGDRSSKTNESADQNHSSGQNTDAENGANQNSGQAVGNAYLEVAGASRSETGPFGADYNDNALGINNDNIHNAN